MPTGSDRSCPAGRGLRHRWHDVPVRRLGQVGQLRGFGDGHTRFAKQFRPARLFDEQLGLSPRDDYTSDASR